MIDELKKGKVTRDDVVLVITEGHIDYDGGYPYGYEWIGNTLVVAELDPGKELRRTILNKYEAAEIDKAVEIANKLMDDAVFGDDGETDKEDAINEALYQVRQ